MMRAVRYCLAIFLGAALIAEAQSNHTFRPATGYVPDEATAIKIAVAVWEPIYGAGQIAGEKPYHGTLRNGVWTVTGSLPEGMNGGVALAEISKEDGRIMRISHGK